ncbi:BolA like protein (plasmid) [Legionella adelaidensis]|uniref:BolA like protein n=1 Tax=Legionella adelaidensis TaxID=45056 RepID=A0A0W0R3W3_9GAMM|nr:BolA/IbaG family iron-sulfur metabolism protein [Legionella adelaidensis]KTC65735.1 BolA like protein [Legionella adelaidensis]VEH85099.1 BolA like protein [Legionella adelaidensis]
MISNEEIEQKLLALENVDYVKVKGDGYHFQLVIVSDVFNGKSKVARQQWVYSQLKDDIIGGSLHAISMQTLTNEEWEKQHG